MGVLEERMRKRDKIGRVQRAVLKTVSFSGVLSVALLTPNALQVLKQFGFAPRARQTEVIRRARERLLARGLLKYARNGYLELTAKGESELACLERTNYQLPKPKRWDGKWRILIFDISEKRKWLRDRIRATLIAIGFKRLQYSVFIYPYDCEDVVALLKADFKIGKDLLYMIVDELESDRHLCDWFGLNK